MAPLSVWSAGRGVGRSYQKRSYQISARENDKQKWFSREEKM
jgi:hypothetical protein